MRTTTNPVLAAQAGEREALLIGSLINQPSLYPELAEILRTPLALANEHAMLAWTAISDAWTEQSTTEELYLAAFRAIPTGAGQDWLRDAARDVIALAVTARQAAREVADAYARRKTALELRSLAASLERPDKPMPTETLLAELHGLYSRLADEDNKRRTGADIKSVLDRLQATRERNLQRGSIGWKTGFVDLHADGIEYQPGHLWVVGGWTSVGKTAWMVEAVTRFLGANPDGSAAVFSTEMTDQQNAVRLLANQTGAPGRVILGGGVLHQEHADRLEATWGWLREQRLWLYSNLLDIDAIAVQCRKLNMKSGGLNLVCIDFLQNVRGPGRTQYEMMSDIARKLQALALELECCIVALSQIPNQARRDDVGAVEYKGAGEIGAACDIGIWLKRSREDKRQLLLEVRKNRHGPTGDYRLQYDEATWTRLEELGKVVVAPAPQPRRNQWEQQ